jgi:hypothetical protein
MTAIADLAAAVKLVTADLTEEHGESYTADEAISEVWDTLTVDEIESWRGQDLLTDEVLNAYLAILFATAPELDRATELLEN